ncbi:hypothetical protein [Psychroflexus sp. MBR-150]|jgi:hypothetical protein
MKSLLYILLLIFPLLSIAQTSPKQTRGEVFRAYNDNPSQDTRETTLEVKRSLYGYQFKDDAIPNVYKKAVEKFFDESFRTKYDRMGKYTLKLERRDGYLFIEDRKVIKDPETP